MNSLQGLKTYMVSDIGHLSFYIYTLKISAMYFWHALCLSVAVRMK